MKQGRTAALGLLVVAIAGATAWWLVRPTRPLDAPSRAPMTASDPHLPLPPPITVRREETALEPAKERTVTISTAAVESEAPGEHPRRQTQKSRLFGKLVSAKDRSPVRDAVIGAPSGLAATGSFDEAVLVPGEVEERSRSDARGRFSLDGEKAPDVLEATAHGFGPILFESDWLGATEESELVLPLTGAATLRACVTDRVGAPQKGVEVRLTARAWTTNPIAARLADRLLMKTILWREPTDERGIATLTTLPAGVPVDVELWTSHGLVLRDAKSLVFEEDREISKEWRLGSGCMVSGRVIDQLDRPVVGRELWLTQRGLNLSCSRKRVLLYSGDEDEVAKKVVTEEDGRFVLDDVAPGRWWLGIAADWRSSSEDSGDESAIAPVAESLVITENQVSAEFSLHVHRGLYIRGKVVNPDGTPSDGFVRAQSVGDELAGFGSGRPRKDGTFALGPLEPGKYEVSAEPIPSDEFSRVLTGSPPTVVAAGSVDVVLTFRSGGTICPKAVRKETGDVVDANFCLVSATHPTFLWGGGQYSPNTLTDFVGLEPDSYDLAAITPDGRFGRIQGIVLAAGQVLEGVRVPVEPGASVTLRYSGTESEYASVSLWLGSTYCGGDGIHRGTSVTMAAPRGRVIVRWQAGTARFDETVDLTSGESREVVWPRQK